MADYYIQEINDRIKDLKEKGISVKDVSDGYHSFGDLYNHREVLTAALLNKLPFTWKSKVHEDGTMFDGMFIVGACTPYGHITYHYNLEHWGDFKVPVIPHAPKFDGHSPDDVIKRIREYCCRPTPVLSEEESEKMKAVIQDVVDTFDNNAYAIAQYIGTFTK